MRIVEIRQKWPNRSLIITSHFKNDADRAAVVGVQYWIQIRNCETILVKMVCELLKSVKKKRRQHCFCVLNAVHSKLYTKNIAILYFWWILTIRTPIDENCFTIWIFYSKSKSEKCRSNGVAFKVSNQTLASVQSIFVGFQRFTRHFDENCLTIPNIFSK